MCSIVFVKAIKFNVLLFVNSKYFFKLSLVTAKMFEVQGILFLQGTTCQWLKLVKYVTNPVVLRLLS